MFVAIIYAILGPIGRAVLGFYFDYQTQFNVAFLLWALVMTASSIQLRSVRIRTIAMARSILDQHPELGDAEVWEAIQPDWQVMVRQTARFVPNRWNLWVQRPRPEHVVRLLQLGPEWMAALRAGEVRRDALCLPGPNSRIEDFGK